MFDVKSEFNKLDIKLKDRLEKAKFYIPIKLNNNLLQPITIPCTV